MSAEKPSPPIPSARLYLATPPVGEPAEIADRLAELLDTADIAAVLLRLKPADDRTLINRIKALASMIQARGVAVLLDGHVELVARSGADGANVSGIEAVRQALSVLKPDRMVGAAGLQSRHDSMIAGELGADYLLFGEPSESGQRPDIEAIVERLQWWVEVFQPPCVGYAQQLSEVRQIAATGAEFIMIGEAVWSDARGPKQALLDVAAAVAGDLAAAERGI